MANATHEVECQLHAFERNRYFYGKLLTVRDFETEQRYTIGKDRLINRVMHGVGIVCGLDIANPAVEDAALLVDLAEGVALDCCGHEIVVSRSGRVEVQGYVQEGPNYLYLRYAECVKEPVPALANASSCEEVCCYNRIQETYEVVVLPDPPVLVNAAFSGVVEAAAGSRVPGPLAGAKVEALLPANRTVQAATWTNAEGQYTLAVAAGAYEIRASATGYTPHLDAQDRSIAAGQTIEDVNFILQEASSDIADTAALCHDKLQQYYTDHLRVCPDCNDPKVLLAVVELPGGGGAPSLDENATHQYRAIVSSNPLLRDLLCDHLADPNNPHQTTAAQVGALVSVNDVSNPGGNIELTSSDNSVTIAPNADARTINLTVGAPPGAVTIPSGRVLFEHMEGRRNIRESPPIPHGLNTDHIAIVLAVEMVLEGEQQVWVMGNIENTVVGIGNSETGPVLWVFYTEGETTFTIALKDRRQFIGDDPPEPLTFVVRWWAIPKTQDRPDVLVLPDGERNVSEAFLGTYIAMNPGTTLDNITSDLQVAASAITPQLAQLQEKGRIRIVNNRFFPNIPPPG